MSWRGPAFSTLLIGIVYWVVRPVLVEQVGPQVYIAGLIVVSVVIGVGTASWLARRSLYACGHCNHTFSVSTSRHLIGQNWFGRLSTRCPSCEQTSLCSPVPSVNPSSGDPAGP